MSTPALTAVIIVPQPESTLNKWDEEASVLYRACTGLSCPNEIISSYADWVRNRPDAAELPLPAFIRRWPQLMALCEPLPGVNPEFDARRAAIVTMAESHQASAKLFYRYEPVPAYMAIARVGFATLAELLKLPLRFCAGRWLWT